jgi:hypothetical protein
MLKKTIVAALCAALAACGGDDSDDPAARTFTYGTPTTPTYDEQAAASDGGFLLQDGATYRTSGDTTAGETASGSLPSLPDQLAGEVFGDSMMSLPAPVAKQMGGAIGGVGFRALAYEDGYGFDNPACLAMSPGLVRYQSCVVTMPDGTVMTVNGQFSLSGDVFAWDLTVGVSLNDVEFGMAMTASNHLYGSITFGATTIVGRARSDMSGSVTMDGQNFRFGATTIADLDLQYTADPAFCVTGGTLELRRVWTRRPTGATAADLPDEGVKFTWQGCGSVLVQRGQ